MNWKRCLESKSIKIEPNAPERVASSLEMSERFLNSARKNMDIDEYEMVHLASYNSAFHSARALLFARGYTERSHICINVALKHLYKENKELSSLLNTFDKIRISRHNVQYAGNLVEYEEADFVIVFAETFLKTAKNILIKTA